MRNKTGWLLIITCLNLMVMACYVPAASAVRATVPVEQQDSVGIGRVDALPTDNLIYNPWFRTGNQASLDGWIVTSSPSGGWGASQKPGNPTPDDIVGTAARVSTGRGQDRSGKNIDPGADTYLAQVVSANPEKRILKFDMYWVTHTVNPAIVTVYGGFSPQGPWNAVWQPFHQVHTKPIHPESGRGQDLWVYYSDSTDLAITTLSQGYPYYRLEIRANLPDENGGFKISGVYFTVDDEVQIGNRLPLSVLPNTV